MTRVEALRASVLLMLAFGALAPTTARSQFQTHSSAATAVGPCTRRRLGLGDALKLALATEVRLREGSIERQRPVAGESCCYGRRYRSQI
jgi:hypothetical protein